ncbi:hypothetical protein AB0E55_04630 [Amycolatopsis keratiniphila]|uniref:hypothetical protein n=1 Tax=Amycolatopsis keratiniphila TaxID=129921 RepID=UPI0033F20A74
MVFATFASSWIASQARSRSRVMSVCGSKPITTHHGKNAVAAGTSTTLRWVPTERDQAPGDYVHEALLLKRPRAPGRARRRRRARPSAIWEEIGAAAGGITKQLAQRRWAGATEIVDALADGIGSEGLRSRKALTSLQVAEDLDAWYLRHREPGDVADDTDRPVSGYLDNHPSPAGHARRVPADIVRSTNLLEAQ